MSTATGCAAVVTGLTMAMQAPPGAVRSEHAPPCQLGPERQGQALRPHLFTGVPPSAEGGILVSAAARGATCCGQQDNDAS